MPEIIDDSISYWTDGENDVVYDARYFPVLMHIGRGSGTPELFTFLYEQRQRYVQRAKDEGVKCVQILHVEDWKPPPADERKMAAEFAKKYDADCAGTCLAMYFIMSNRLIRGALTAISWITGGDEVPLIPVASIADAAALADKALARHQNVSPFPRDYEVPPFKSDW